MPSRFLCDPSPSDGPNDRPEKGTKRVEGHCLSPTFGIEEITDDGSTDGKYCRTTKPRQEAKCNELILAARKTARRVPDYGRRASLVAIWTTFKVRTEVPQI